MPHSRKLRVIFLQALGCCTLLHGGSTRACRAWPPAWPRRQARRVGRSPVSKVGACAQRHGDATEGSALTPEGPRPGQCAAFRPGDLWSFARRSAHLARDDRPGQLAERGYPRCVTAGRGLRWGAGRRRGGQRPATVRYRARGSGPGYPVTCGESPQHPGRHSAALLARSRSSCSSRAFFARPAWAGRPGARRCAL